MIQPNKLGAHNMPKVNILLVRSQVQKKGIDKIRELHGELPSNQSGDLGHSSAPNAEQEGCW